MDPSFRLWDASGLLPVRAPAIRPRAGGCGAWDAEAQAPRLPPAGPSSRG
jgi:hypothetical protein